MASLYHGRGSPRRDSFGKEMIERPLKCCPTGSYKCTIPMPINGRRRDIDLCIADIVAALNAANIVTVASCCGHGKHDGNIELEDGRTITIKEKK